MTETADLAMLERTMSADWTGLARQLKRQLVFAGDERMLVVAKQFSAGKPLVVPHVLISCGTTDDVRRVLSFLREHGLGFSIRSGGHCFGDLSLHPGVVIDLSAMDGVAVEGDKVRIGPGVSGESLAHAMAAIGRVVPTGGCPWVALGGISLAGGFGMLGRRHGLVTDQVLGTQVVTAQGSVVQANDASEPDLFWALRGAGTAGFGVVTELTLKTLPAEKLSVLHGVWPLQDAAELLMCWQAWAPEAPPDVNLEVGLMGPDYPEVEPRAELFGVILGGDSARQRHAMALSRAFGRFARDLSCYELEGRSANEYLVGLLDRRAAPAWQPSRPYRQTGYQFTRSDFFDAELAADAIAGCIEVFRSGRVYAQFRELEFVPWGGAYASPQLSACFLHRQPRMLVRHTVMLGSGATADLREASQRWVDASQNALSRHANGHAYQGYADLRREDWPFAYYGHACTRLRQIKGRYDPDDFFRHAQSIRPDKRPACD
jgi:FAD/FMN-containing dehydrogenase